MTPVETTDVLVVGTGFGGAIPAYNLAAARQGGHAGARPELATEDFEHKLRIGSYTRIVDLVNGDGIQVVAGNCVGGSSVVYFAASLRAPSFVFDRRGSSSSHRLWLRALTRHRLDPWYDRCRPAGWATTPRRQR